jgi:hypothetical protein
VRLLKWFFHGHPQGEEFCHPGRDRSFQITLTR